VAGNPNFIRHHHFDIGEVAFDGYLLQLSGPCSGAGQELQQISIGKMIRQIGQERR